MREALLDLLAEKCGCYISSLPLKTEDASLIRLLRGLHAPDYSLEEWAGCLDYLYREGFSPDSYHALDDFLRKKEDEL